MLPNISREPSAAPARKYVGSQDNTKTLLGVAGQINVYGMILENNHTADVFLQLFNAAATTDVTLGTTDPDQTVRIPASGAAILDMIRPFCSFNLGCVFAVTSTRTGSSAPGANSSVTIYYSQR